MSTPSLSVKRFFGSYTNHNQLSVSSTSTNAQTIENIQLSPFPPVAANNWPLISYFRNTLSNPMIRLHEKTSRLSMF